MYRSCCKWIYATIMCFVLSGCGGGSGSDPSSVSETGSCMDCTASTLTLRWDPNAVSEGVIGYYVYYGVSDTNATQLISDISIVDPDFDVASPQARYSVLQDLGLESGDPACFRIKAYNNYAVSDYSQVVCIEV